MKQNINTGLPSETLDSVDGLLEYQLTLTSADFEALVGADAFARLNFLAAEAHAGTLPGRFQDRDSSETVPRQFRELSLLGFEEAANATDTGHTHRHTAQDTPPAPCRSAPMRHSRRSDGGLSPPQAHAELQPPLRPAAAAAASAAGIAASPHPLTEEPHEIFVRRYSAATRPWVVGFHFDRSCEGDERPVTPLAV